jgi:hypothetical protein
MNARVRGNLGTSHMPRRMNRSQILTSRWICLATRATIRNISDNNNNNNPMAQQPITGPAPPVRFLDHEEGLLGRMTSSPRGGQVITLRKLLINPDPLTGVLWQLDQQTHLVPKQGIEQETWQLNFAYTASLHSLGAFTCRISNDKGQTALLPLRRKAGLRIFKIRNTRS